MCYKNTTIILFVFIVFLFGLFVFWQQMDFKFLGERKFLKPESDGFEQLYVVEIPSQSKYFADGASGKFYDALQPEEDIISQNPKNILPGLLQFFDVEYVLLQDKEYWELFEPFINYFPGEEKEELPRTFAVKKEALSFPGEPFLVLGDGWYAPGKNVYGVAERGFGKEAIIQYIIPPGTLNHAPDFLSFLAPWSPLPEKGRKAEIEVIVNGKAIYSSNFYDWVVLKLSDLQEGINEIKLRSPKGCVVPEGDGRCLSFVVQKLELFGLEDISPERLFKLDRFIETEEGQYWVKASAAIRIFTLSPKPALISFQLRAIESKARMISIIEKKKEIKRIILFGEEFQEIELSTYQQGENVFYFSADDCEDKIIDEKKQCITAQIKGLEIRFPE